MITDFLQCNATGAMDFYEAPLGLAVAAVLAITASMRVLRPRKRDHWADTLYFSLMALVNLMALAACISSRVPHYAIKSMLILLAIRAIWRAAEDWHQGEFKQ